MTGIDYILISVLYFWASSTALSIGVGYYTIYRPVVAGFITGLILGNPILGMVAGAAVNIIYIDFVSTGGSFKGDQCLTGIIAAIAAILFDLSFIEASAAAYPFGFLGIFIWKYRLNINSVFVRKFEKEYEKGNNPNISFYDGLLPQLLLYVMSTAVIISAVLIMVLLNNFILKIKNGLYLIGLFLIFISVWNILYKINNKNGIIIFIVAFFITIIGNPSSLIVSLIVLLIIVIIFDKNILHKENKKINKGLLNKKDLIYSWFIWMNFSHSCYSYERLQGLGFAHCMKNIFKKIHKNNNDVAKAIYRHSNFFNTEPNMGTPIIGYIISQEEQEGSNSDNILYIKKGMMGIAAGLGDSYTQVVLTPLSISLSIMLCLDNNFYIALLPIIMLAIIILVISYTGFMRGYYEGRESLIERINSVKNSRVKKYFPYIFTGILGVSLGKLIMFNKDLTTNLTIYAVVGIISIVYSLIKIKRSLNK